TVTELCAHSCHRCVTDAPACQCRLVVSGERCARLSATLTGVTIVSTDTSLAHAAAPPSLLDVRAVAALLGCSPRHVYRLADAGRMPAPVRLGALVRWRRQDLDAWLADGCRPV